ncbi:sigma 54-interacting transcriptional regulator [Skermanella pratensis]|uniref:sigma 54-interacting transcriptional regulator n=1 Tax=Skermanella pratensis TaxID=2233999 RepID=UPI001301962B|nr:sigma 54-interacting transcriptional regulator [Skermanella pratensis]
MRIDISFTDRVGIAHEVLAVLAARRLNVVAVEVDPPDIFIDAPELTGDALDGLREALLEVAGVEGVAPVDMLPGVRRRLHLAAVLAAMPDPVLAVDAGGMVILTNAAADDIVGGAALSGKRIAELTDDEGFQREMVANGFQVPAREVMLRGQPFQVDVRPVADQPSQVAGGVLTLHAPSRIGERLQALRNFDEGGFDAILGDSPAMKGLKARAARLAAVEAPLLILGETGTGKELIAHACHRASSRMGKTFLALNCAALPENLAESELFGYAPGSFTGAQRGGKPGLLELAHQGTVFLDEVGELSPYLQAKLLRFLNDGSFRRVGGDHEMKVDVRIISATHRKLDQMVAERAFREDLYYRLNVLALQVPALRERGDDILLLARHFILRACAQVQRRPCRLTAGAAGALLANPWRGNVRQLESVIFRAVTMTDGPWLDAPDLEIANSRMAAEPGRSGDGLGDECAGSWEEAVAEFERSLLDRLFPRFPSSRKLAARLKTSHTMVANKLRKYGIPQGRGSGGG